MKLRDVHPQYTPQVVNICRSFKKGASDRSPLQISYTVDSGDGAPWSRRTISSTILSLTSTMDYSISSKHIFHLYTSHDVCSRSLSSDCRSLLSLQTATAVNYISYMSILSYVSLIRPVLNVVLQLNMYANYIIIYIIVLQYCCKILYPR